MRASTATHNTNDWNEMKNVVEQKLRLIKTAFDLVRLKWSSFKCVKVQKKSNSKNKLVEFADVLLSLAVMLKW